MDMTLSCSEPILIQNINIMIEWHTLEPHSSLGKQLSQSSQVTFFQTYKLTEPLKRDRDVSPSTIEQNMIGCGVDFYPEKVQCNGK